MAAKFGGGKVAYNNAGVANMLLAAAHETGPPIIELRPEGPFAHQFPGRSRRSGEGQGKECATNTDRPRRGRSRERNRELGRPLQGRRNAYGARTQGFALGWQNEPYRLVAEHYGFSALGASQVYTSWP